MWFELLEQLALSFAATICFGLLLHVPQRHFIDCGVVGAIGWIVYWAMMRIQPSPVVASLLAVIPLTIATRVFAVIRHAPVTLFLIPGIFPLVPGAGIYYTAYAFITGDSAQCALKGAETLKVAAALAMGMAMVISIPIKQKIPGKRKQQ